MFTKMNLQPHSAKTDHFTFVDTADGVLYEFQHRLWDIPLPRSTMHNITLTATDDGGAIYAYDYTVTTADEEGNVLSENTEHAEHFISAEQLEVIKSRTATING